MRKFHPRTRVMQHSIQTIASFCFYNTPRPAARTYSIHLQAFSTVCFVFSSFTVIRKFISQFVLMEPLLDVIVGGSIRIFNALKEKLTPTSTKLHYLFNLRDLSKLFQGIYYFKPESLKDDARSSLIRLWAHEISRGK
jgi:hypothetical protein